MDQNGPRNDKKSPTPEPSLAYVVGRWINVNLIYITLLVAVVWLAYRFVPVFAAAEVQESNALTTYVMAARHRNCKGSGGCGKGCPFTDHNDPRIAAQEQISSMEHQNDFIQLAFRQAKKRVEEEEDDVEGPLASILTIKERCALNSSAMTNMASKIYDSYGNRKTVDSKVILAKNRINALEAALRINFNVFMCALTAEASYKTNRKLKSLTKLQTDKVHDYDAKMATVLSAVKEIETAYNSMTSETSTTSTFSQHVATVMDDNASSDKIIEAMALLINQAISITEQLNYITAQYERVHRTDQFIMAASADSFSNKLPSEMNAAAMTDLIANGNYDAALIKTALEPDIATNHRKFAKERASFDSGGGVPSVRDDDNDVVPWVGIFGRPSYRRSDGSSAEKASTTMQLKSIPSDNPEDLMRAKTPRLSLV